MLKGIVQYLATEIRAALCGRAIQKGLRLS